MVVMATWYSRNTFIHGLRSLLDIGLTLEKFKAELDWKMVIDLAHQGKMGKCVYLTLCLARDLLGVSVRETLSGTVPGTVLEAVPEAVPEAVLNSLRPENFDDQYLHLAKREVFSKKHQESKVLASSPNIALLFNSKGVMSKLVLILERIFPSKETMARLYPAPADSVRIYFYYPRRLLDLLVKHRRKMRSWFCDRNDLSDAARQTNESSSLKEWLLSP